MRGVTGAAHSSRGNSGFTLVPVSPCAQDLRNGDIHAFAHLPLRRHAVVHLWLSTLGKSLSWRSFLLTSSPAYAGISISTDAAHVFVLPAIREGCQPVQTDIDADRGMGRSTECHRAFLPQSTQTTMRRFWSHGGKDLARKAQFLSHIHPSQLWHIDPVVADAEFVVREIERGPRTFLALEFRIPDLAARFTPLKEVRESGSHIHERAYDAHIWSPHRPRETALF